MNLIIEVVVTDRFHCINFSYWSVSVQYNQHVGKIRHFPPEPMEDHHYRDVTMGVMASQITRLTIVYQTCFLNRFFRRRSKKISKLRVTGLWGGNSPATGEFPHKWPVARKMFLFDDVIMHTVQIYHSLNVGLYSLGYQYVKQASCRMVQ